MKDVRVAQRELNSKLARVARWERQHGFSRDVLFADYSAGEVLFNGEVIIE